MDPLLTWIRRTAPDQRSDADLLAAFLADHDERAFAEVVRRHGPVVWGVCRRMLPDPADADDAFQATFLVLVRRGYRPAAPLAPWLHRVAHLTARGVRRRNARRLARTVPLSTDVPARADPPPVELDRSLLRLPEKYRAAVVLCCLHGLTEREAAEQIGCPVGTLSARVSRGLAKLRRYVGVEPRAVLAAATVPAATAVAAVRVAVVVRVASQVTGVVPAGVSSLVHRVSRMLWLSKAIRAAFVVAVAAGGLALAAAAGQPSPPPKPIPKPPVPAEEKPAPAKPAEPDWKAEFQKAYGLNDDEVLKRVAPPYPAVREKWFVEWGRAFLPAPPAADGTYLFFWFRNNKVVYGHSLVHGPVVVGPPRGPISFVLENGFRLPLQGVEAAPEILDTQIDGEFVFRLGTAPEKWVPVLEKILWNDCALPFRLKLMQVEREVVVVSGEYKSNPREGQRPNTVVVAADPAGPLEGGSIGRYEEFLAFLSKFTEKRIVSDVKRPPAVQFWWRHQSGIMTRKEGREVYKEDRDPDAILKAVAEQTGLKFKTETRKVPVLSIVKEVR
jgi:RNA polymerase sigma factor (sigma-70 family)